MSIQKSRIARVSTVPFFVITQLRTQIETIKKSGAEVTIVTSEDKLSSEIRSLQGVDFFPVNIERAISPFKDLKSLFILIKLFRNKKFDIIHSTTPKAGLLCAIAGLIAGVGIRLHTFTGQPWVTMTGFKKTILKWCDKVIARLNTHCYTDSFSQRDFLVKSHIISQKNISVIGSGSLAGVDLQRFNPLRFSTFEKNDLKSNLGIPPSSKVLLFVGRVTPDKGVSELIQAFQEVLKVGLDVFLIFIGPFEADGKLIIDSISDRLVLDRIRSVGFSSEPERYMAISDILCLPSYREGFGTVVIEAAAMGVPTIGTLIYGLTDAIDDGETGILVPVKSYKALAEAIGCLVSDTSLRQKMSRAAQKRAKENFDSEVCSQLLIREYESFLNEHKK